MKINYNYGASDKNNGNVTGQQITIQSQFQATQTSTYDSMNRLKSASESGAWQQV